MYLHLIGICLAALSPAAIDASDALPCGQLAYAAMVVSCDDEGECDEGEASELVVIGARESRGRAGVVGDSGAARGRYQLHVEWRQGHRAEELDADEILDARLARDALRTLERTCGSRESAMCAYASGGCHRAVDLARERCRLAGGCDRRD